MHTRTLLSLALAATSLAAPPMASASVFGTLGNFDVINDTGSTAHGFEIELEGLHLSEITDTFGGANRGFPSGRGFDPQSSVVRYGSPVVSEYTNGASFGVVVRYQGLFDGTSWDYGTPSGTFITPGDNCWSGGGLGYSAATPCDHFGVGTSRNPTRTTYNWLLETPTPGVLTNGSVNLPAPLWSVVPAAPPAPGQAAAPPVVQAVIRAPAPLEAPGQAEPQFGEAIWVKVFTTELPEAVKLEDLVHGNPKMDQAETEVEWQLLQVDPSNPESGQLESGYGVPVGPNAASILRRYEFFRYSGAYDPENHEALVDSDSHPLDSELGNFLGAQNGAVNLNALNISPVPEPRTYGMLAAGLALIAAIARRKGQHRAQQGRSA
jgi:hypothetical protein